MSISSLTGATVASGGPYGTAGGTVTESFCAAEGCYTFTIFDSFGDGICCAYGTGDYSFTVDGATVAAGGEFGDSEAKEIWARSPGSLEFPYWCILQSYGALDNTGFLAFPSFDLLC